MSSEFRSSDRQTDRQQGLVDLWVMGIYGDLWGFIFTWSIYNKSMLGFITRELPINPHKSDRIYGDLWGFMDNKSMLGFMGIYGDLWVRSR